MVLEIEMGKRLNAKIEVPSYMPPADDNFAKELEEELMKFTFDDSKVGAAPVATQTKEAPIKADNEVDIMECRRPGLVDEVPCQDTTESSSSFGDSGCDDDDTLGDDASSSFRGDAESVGDPQRDMFGTRRKKLTAHWRAFIQPLMWRCKWTELQIKKFDLQAKRYDRALAKLREQKHLELESSVSKGVAAKAIPFSRSNHTAEVLRRKKRRRAETTVDVAAVMSNHNLFSYYENRKNGNEAAFMDKAKNPGKACQKIQMDENGSATDEFLLAQLGDGNDPTEHILRKIISVEFQVGEMRNRADKIVADNAEKFSSLEELGLDETDLIAPLHNGDGTSIGTNTASQSTSEHTMTDKVMRDTATTSKVVTADPDVVMKSEGLTSFADTLRKGEDVLVYTKRRRQERNNFNGVKIEPTEMHPGQNHGLGSSSVPVGEESDLPVEDDQPPHKVRSIASLSLPLVITKGKRARRKSAGRPPQRLSG